MKVISKRGTFHLEGVGWGQTLTIVDENNFPVAEIGLLSPEELKLHIRIFSPEHTVIEVVEEDLDENHP